MGGTPQTCTLPSAPTNVGLTIATCSGKVSMVATKISIVGIVISVSSFTTKQYFPFACRNARLLFSEKPRISLLSMNVTHGKSSLALRRLSGVKRYATTSVSYVTEVYFLMLSKQGQRFLRLFIQTITIATSIIILFFFDMNQSFSVVLDK